MKQPGGASETGTTHKEPWWSSDVFSGLPEFIKVTIPDVLGAPVSFTSMERYGKEATAPSESSISPVGRLKYA